MKPTLHGHLVSIGVCSRSFACSLALCYAFTCMVVAMLYTEVSLELGAHDMIKVVQLFLGSPFKFYQKAVNIIMSILVAILTKKCILQKQFAILEISVLASTDKSFQLSITFGSNACFTSGTC